MNYTVGVKNNIKTYQMLIIAAFGLLFVLALIFWALYAEDVSIRNFYYNGVEVEAEIVSVDYVDIDDNDDSGHSTRYWATYYEYISSEGTEYSGQYHLYPKKEQAQAHIGDKLKIIIDPNSDESTLSDFEFLESNLNNIYVDLPLACVFSGMFCVSAYLLFYRVVYRNVMDKNILKKYGTSFINRAAEGEVIKTFGLLWYYVKVKYYDEKGIPKEKWARSWFTRNEAKFLEQKRFIKIAPYKNTYGILEEMPIEKKSKQKSKEEQ